MPTVVQFRRGTTAQNNSFTGAVGEISIDTTLGTIRVHDGSTAGGTTIVNTTAAQTLTNKTIPSISGDVTVSGNIVYGVSAVLGGSRTVSSIATAPVAIDWFGSSAYRSGKYVISVTDVTNSQYQTSEIVLVQDGTTATISTYGVVLSGSTARMTFTANIMTGNVIIWGTGVSASNTVKLQKTLIPV